MFVIWWRKENCWWSLFSDAWPAETVGEVTWWEGGFAALLSVNLGGWKIGLVTATGACRIVDPVESNKWQAANHEDDSHH